VFRAPATPADAGFTPPRRAARADPPPPGEGEGLMERRSSTEAGAGERFEQTRRGSVFTLPWRGRVGAERRGGVA
jgi:hypothetical protein